MLVASTKVLRPLPLGGPAPHMISGQHPALLMERHQAKSNAHWGVWWGLGWGGAHHPCAEPHIVACIEESRSFHNNTSAPKLDADKQFAPSNELSSLSQK